MTVCVTTLYTKMVIDSFFFFSSINLTLANGPRNIFHRFVFVCTQILRNTDLNVTITIKRRNGRFRLNAKRRGFVGKTGRRASRQLRPDMHWTRLVFHWWSISVVAHKNVLTYCCRRVAIKDVIITQLTARLQ